MDYNSNTADPCEWDFVGRRAELLRLEKAYATHRLFGIFGMRSVGKSRYVKEFLRSREIKTIYVELRLINSLNMLYSNICAQIGEEPITSVVETTNWLSHLLASLIYVSREETIVLNFDNAEDAIEGSFGDDLMLILSYVMKNCKNVKIFISSTTRVQFSQLHKIFYSIELPPFSKQESLELLQIVADEVDLGEYSDAIVNLSEGLPLVLLMIGSTLKEDDGLFTPEDMVELLVNSRLETLSNEFYPKEDRVGDVYRQFILRLSKEFQIYMTDLDYIPGSFNAKEAGGLLDLEGSQSQAMVKHNILAPIRRRNILTYDAGTGRFNIQGILREVIKATFAIKDLPELRKRYCEVFTEVVGNISEKLGSSEYASALTEFAAEQPNLVKLLGDVAYTRQDTYNFFIEIAAQYTALIERFMPAESDRFYQNCLRLSEMYNRLDDKAMVHLAIGSMATNIKGDLVNGQTNYKHALEVLESMETTDSESKSVVTKSDTDKKLHLATGYQRMGWNMHKQGKNDEAVKYYKKSLKISIYGGKLFEPLVMQSFSSMGIAYTFLGHLDTAEKYHTACLKRREATLGREHPYVGACINNIALVLQQKGEFGRALEYHLRALELKRLSNAPVISIINSLSNVANAYNDLSRFQDAHTLVNEAFDLVVSQNEIRMKDAEALLYNTRGKIYSKEGKLAEARLAFEKTAELSQEISLHGFLFMRRLVSLAKVLERLSEYPDCLWITKEALKLKDETIKHLPHNDIVTDCLQCMSRVYRAIDDRLNYVQSLYDIEAECLRRERVCYGTNVDTKLQEINKVLEDVRQKMENLEL
ncbi:hypothetical protein ACF0H5_007167 [Mactra antiquata]